jgi:hypothetical protein
LSRLLTLKTALLLLFFNPLCQAQRFSSVVFNKLPQDFQLYPRNADNEAVVPVSGIVETAGWKYISVQMTRNDVPTRYLKADIQYNQKGQGLFSLETKIKAELAGYGFKVFVSKGTDSVLIVTRQNVVSGDVYVLSGQSNSTGFFTESDTSLYCRTFGTITDNLNTYPYNAADTLWSFSNKKAYENGVGTMGLEIQKQLMQKSGIPNCLINAGFHWSSAFGHAQRTESNPADLYNGYGRMLYRLQKGGLEKSVKAYIFRQGETEAYHEGGNWSGNFDILYKNLKRDLPGIQKLYVFQIDIIYYPSPVGAELRDYQRRLPDIYPDIRSLATVGTTGFDGLHYSREGNRQSGLELSRMMLKDLYNSKDTVGVNSPAIKKVFYKSEEKKQLILVFDEGQELVYPEPYHANPQVTLQMKDFFYLDGASGAVTSGKAEGNRIILELNGARQEKSINYLPMYIQEGGPYYPFRGPYITNKLGMRAFTFYSVPISIGLPIPALSAQAAADGTVKLQWNHVAGTEVYTLERKMEGEDSYHVVATISSPAAQYIDESAAAGTGIHYRLKGSNETAESSDYSYARIEAPIVLGTEDKESFFSVFPNPVPKHQPVTIQFHKVVKGKISIINGKGQYLSGENVNYQKEIKISVPDKTSGYHFIRFDSEGRVWNKKLLLP